MNELARAEARAQVVKEIFAKLEAEMLDNKSENANDFGELQGFDGTSQISKSAILRSMTAEDREFVENVDAEYYKRVRTSDEFYRRKKLILLNLEKLEAKVAHQAESFDEHRQLRFITMEKAKQKKSILRNFVKLEDFKRQ